MSLIKLSSDSETMKSSWMKLEMLYSKTFSSNNFTNLYKNMLKIGVPSKYS